MEDEVLSPCLKICTLDPTKSYCTGCFRILYEIQTWPWMNDKEKAMTVALCELRKVAYELDEKYEKPKRKARRTKPCSGHDSQG